MLRRRFWRLALVSTQLTMYPRSSDPYRPESATVLGTASVMDPRITRNRHFFVKSIFPAKV
jgi:hypothetical protein